MKLEFSTCDSLHLQVLVPPLLPPPHLQALMPGSDAETGVATLSVALSPLFLSFS